MDAIRSLRQPGPAHPTRIDAFQGDIHPLHFALQPGISLNQAVTGPMIEAGFQCATIVLKAAALNPFRYVMPGPADDETHVAYFTAPRAPSGTTTIEQANATFGWADGQPLIHCHGAWVEPDGSRRGGHILPSETIVVEPGEAVAWGFRSIRIDAALDPETNFTLLQPHASRGAGGRGLVARIKPNQDILQALETIARRHGFGDAVVRGSLGSLIGARFSDGSRVEDHATEVLVRSGTISRGIAALDMLVVDMRGQVRQGWLRRGENPVCITFDVVLEAPDP